jgi:hypothetical protein
VSLRGLLVGALAALPPLSSALPESVGDRVFPPLGDIQPAARAVAAAVALASTFVVFLSRKSLRNLSGLQSCATLLAAIVFFSLYLAVYIRSVKHYTGANSEVTVSIGFERTEFAKKNYGDNNDIEMLKAYGPREEEIQKLWTYKSLIEARVSLWLFYTLTITAFVWLFSVGTLQHSMEEANRVPKEH